MGWRYEGLFERIMDPDPEQRDLTNWWISEPSTIQVGKMGYRRAVTISGPRMDLEIYPVFGRGEEGRARAMKRNQTPEKQKKLNRERAIRHLVQLAEANFGEQDIHLTLTYRNPPDMERCRKDVRNFLGKVKRYRQRMGMDELKYIYAIEGGREISQGYGVERIHIHMLMNGGVSREDLEAIWERGYANADRLQPNEYGLEAVARYIIKQAGHGKRYGASRNLKQPKTRRSDARTSNRVVKAIAHDIRNEAKAELEAVYPSYRFVDCKVFYSDQLDGVYIRAVMRRRRA
jgi:hypothetical protein